MPSRTITIELKTTADLKQWDKTIRTMEKMSGIAKDLNDSFSNSGDAKKTAQAVASFADSFEKIKANGRSANSTIRNFNTALGQTKTLMDGLPIELKSLASAMKQTAKATQSWSNANSVLNKETAETSKIVNILGRDGKIMGQELQKVFTTTFKDAAGVVQKTETRVVSAGKAMDELGRVIKDSGSDVTNLTSAVGASSTKLTTWERSVVQVTATFTRMQKLLASIGPLLRGLNGIVQLLGGVFSRLANIATKTFNTINRALGSFATNAGAMFARLRSHLNSAGGLFVSFHKTVERSMAASKRATQSFLNSGWSFLTSGYTTRAFGQTTLNRMGMIGQNYLQYDKDLTRASIAANTDPRTIQNMIFGLQQGQYGPAVKNFNADEIANAAYFYASAIGQQITEQNSSQLAPLLNEFLQIANITHTDIETTTKGILVAAQEFGIDPGQVDAQGNLVNRKRVSDIAAEMAYTANISTLEFPDIVESFKMVGPLASSMGATPEDMMTLFYLMSQSGLRGGQAGRGISQTFGRLEDPTAKMMGLASKYYGIGADQESFRKLFFDDNGELKGGVGGLFATLEQGFGGNQGDMAQFLAEMFSENATRALVGAITHMLGDEGGAQAAYEKAYAKIVGGASQDYVGRAIAENNANLAASFTGLQNAWFAVVSAMIDSIKGPLTQAVNYLGSLLFKLAAALRNNPAVAKFIVTMYALVGVLAEVAGSIFIALGSMLLLAKAFNLTQGFGIRVIGMFLGMTAAFAEMIPMILLISTLTTVMAIAWKEDFGGVATFIKGLDIAGLMSQGLEAVRGVVTTLSKAWVEFISVLLGVQTTTENLSNVLGTVFGSYLGTIVYGNILAARDALHAFANELDIVGKITDKYDFVAAFKNMFGAARGLLTYALTGMVTQDVDAGKKFFEALGFEDGYASFIEYGQKLNIFFRQVVNYAKVMWTGVKPILQSIGQSLKEIFQVEDLSGVFKSFAVALGATFVSLLKYVDLLLQGLSYLTDKMLEFGVVIGIVAGIIVGAVIARALVPFDKQIIAMTSRVLDFIVVTVLLGTLEAIFTGLGFAVSSFGILAVAAFAVIAISFYNLIKNSQELQAQLGRIFDNLKGIGADIIMGLVTGFATLYLAIQQFGPQILDIAEAFTSFLDSSDAMKYLIAAFVLWATVIEPVLILMMAMAKLFGLNTIAAAAFQSRATLAFAGVAIAIFALQPAFKKLFEWFGLSESKANTLSTVLTGVAVAGAISPKATAAGAGVLGRAILPMLANPAAIGLGLPAAVVSGTWWYQDKMEADIQGDPNKAFKDYQAALQANKSRAAIDYMPSGWYNPDSGPTFEIGGKTYTIDQIIGMRGQAPTAMDGPSAQKLGDDRRWVLENIVKPWLTTQTTMDYASSTGYVFGGLGPDNSWVKQGPSVTGAAGSGNYLDLKTGQLIDPTTTNHWAASRFSELKGYQGWGSKWDDAFASSAYEPSVEDQAALDTTGVQDEMSKMFSSLYSSLSPYLNMAGIDTSSIDLSSPEAFLSSVAGQSFSLDKILSSTGFDFSDLNAQPGAFMNFDDYQKAAKEEAIQKAIEERYKELTGRELSADRASKGNVGYYTSPGVYVGRTDAQGNPVSMLDQDALNQATQEVANDLGQTGDAAADAAAALQKFTEFSNQFLQSIGTIDFQSAMKGLFDPQAGYNNTSVASVLGQYSSTIIENLKSTTGAETLPWQNEYELMMDAAGTGPLGGLGQGTAGKNLHNVLRPFLETFAQQSGVSVDDLMKEIPMFNAPEQYIGMGQADLLQFVSGLSRDRYSQLDMFGSQAFGDRGPFDTDGFDWQELANYGTAQAATGNLDWNLTDYIMEAWDLTKEEAEAYIKQNQLDPNVVNGNVFEDTALYASALGGQVNVMTPEWMDYFNKVTENGTDKTIEITQAAFDKLPDIVKIGYSNMGYQFVIGGKENMNQMEANANLIKDNLETQYGFLKTLPEMMEDNGWTATVDGDITYIKDQLGNTQFTLPTVDYQAWEDSLNTIDEIIARKARDIKRSQFAAFGGRDNYMNIEHSGSYSQASTYLYGNTPTGGTETTTDSEPMFDVSTFFPSTDEITAAGTEAATVAVTSITTTIETLAPNVTSAVTQINTAVVQALYQLSLFVQPPVAAVINAIAGGLASGSPQAYGGGFALGQAAGQGIVNGLNSKLAQIYTIMAQMRSAVSGGTPTIGGLPPVPFSGGGTSHQGAAASGGLAGGGGGAGTNGGVAITVHNTVGSVGSQAIADSMANTIAQKIDQKLALRNQAASRGMYASSSRPS